MCGDRLIVRVTLYTYCQDIRDHMFILLILKHHLSMFVLIECIIDGDSKVAMYSSIFLWINSTDNFSVMGI